MLAVAVMRIAPEWEAARLAVMVTSVRNWKIAMMVTQMPVVVVTPIVRTRALVAAAVMVNFVLKMKFAMMVTPMLAVAVMLLVTRMEPVLPVAMARLVPN